MMNASSSAAAAVSEPTAESPWADWRDPLVWFSRTLCGDGRGFVELRLRDPATGRMSQDFHPADKPNRVVNRALAAAEVGDVFIGMAVRSRKRGRAEDCIAASMLWADLDDDDVSVNEAGLARCPIPATLVVDSGSEGHVHAYWGLPEPVNLTDSQERSEFVEKLKRLQRAVGSDNVADLPRIMRFPGTLNWKDGDDPRVVAPVEFRP